MGRKYDYFPSVRQHRQEKIFLNSSFLQMVTLRVLDFAITDVLAKMVQTSVTVRDGERLNLRILGVEFLYLFN